MRRNSLQDSAATCRRMERAVNYALNQKKFLITYLKNGQYSFSNNLSENTIRPFTIGRKN
jgi:hypothetical protein